MLSTLRRLPTRLRERPDDALRLVLAVGGALVLLATLLAVILGPAGLGKLQAGLVGAGAIALLLGGVRRIPAPWVAALAVGLALYGYMVRVSGHVAVSFPFVDWIQPQSIDRSRVMPMLGVLLLLLAFRITVASASARRRWVGGIPWRLLGLAGVALLVHYWVVPKHFAIEVLYPDEGDSFSAPIVEEGRLSTCEWSRNIVHDVPIRVLPELIDNESIRARLAHGVHEDQALRRVQAGELGEGAQRRESAVRNTLWILQRGLQAAVVALIAAAAGLGLLLVIPLAAGVRLPRLLSAPVAAWLFFTTLAIPLVNLVFHVAMLVTGLPDADRNRWTSIALTLGFAATVVLVDLAGRVLSQPDRKLG